MSIISGPASGLADLPISTTGADIGQGIQQLQGAYEQVDAMLKNVEQLPGLMQRIATLKTKLEPRAAGAAASGGSSTPSVQGSAAGAESIGAAPSTSSRKPGGSEWVAHADTLRSDLSSLKHRLQLDRAAVTAKVEEYDADGRLKLPKDDPSIEILRRHINTRLRDLGCTTADVFRQADKRGRGALDYNEFRQAIQNMNIPMTQEQAAKVAAMVDTDRSGAIDSDEFDTVFLKTSPTKAATASPDETAARSARDPSVEIFRRHIATRLRDLGCSASDVFREADKRGRGSLDVEEFRQAVHNLNIPMTQETAAKVATIVDTDHSGTIDAEEFERVFLHKPTVVVEDPSKPGRDPALDILRKHIAIRLRDMGITAGDVFKEADKRHKGVLNLNEFRQAIQSLNIPMTPETAVKVAAMVDTDQSGGIDVEEFERVFLRKGAAHVDPETAAKDPALDILRRHISIRLRDIGCSAADVFKAADKRGRGVLELNEFRQAIQNLNIPMTQETAAKVAALVDTDHSGTIEAEEFERMFLATEVKPASAGSSVQGSSRSGHRASLPENDPSLDILRRHIAARLRDLGISAKDVFQQADKRGRGHLELGEFRQAIQNLNIPMTQEIAAKVAALVDTDHSGTIEAEEFERVFLHMNTTHQPRSSRQHSKPDTPDAVGQIFAASNRSADEIAEEQAAAEVAKVRSRRGSVHMDDPSLDILRRHLGIRLRDMKCSVPDVFRGADARGVVDMAQFRQVIRGLNIPMTYETAQKVAALLDADRVGGINVRAFERMFAHKQFVAPQVSASYDPKGEAVKSFKHRLAVQLTDAGMNVRDLFRGYDVNGHGTITFEEFKQAVRHLNIPMSETMARDVAATSGMTGTGDVNYVEFERKFFDPALVTIPEGKRVAGLGQSGLVNSPFGTDSEWGAAKFVDQHFAGRHGASKGGAGQEGATDIKSEASSVVTDVQRNLLHKLQNKTARFRAAMKAHDGDMDGVVSHDEFCRSLKRLGIDLGPEQLWAVLETYDQRGVGAINYYQVADAMDAMLETDDVSATGSSRSSNVGSRAATPARAATVMTSLKDQLETKTSKLKDVFHSLDREGNGLISRDSLRRGLLQMGVRLSDLDFESLAASVDPTGSGRVPYASFCTSLARTGGGTVEVDPAARKQRLIEQRLKNELTTRTDALQHMFLNLDEAGSGRLDRTQTRAGLRSLGLALADDDFEHVMSLLDSGRTGRVSLQDFARVLDLVADPSATVDEARRFGKKLFHPREEGTFALDLQPLNGGQHPHHDQWVNGMKHTPLLGDEGGARGPVVLVGDDDVLDQARQAGSSKAAVAQLKQAGGRSKTPGRRRTTGGDDDNQSVVSTASRSSVGSRMSRGSVGSVNSVGSRGSVGSTGSRGVVDWSRENSSRGRLDMAVPSSDGDRGRARVKSSDSGTPQRSSSAPRVVRLATGPPRPRPF